MKKHIYLLLSLFALQLAAQFEDYTTQKEVETGYAERQPAKPQLNRPSNRFPTCPPGAPQREGTPGHTTRSETAYRHKSGHTLAEIEHRPMKKAPRASTAISWDDVIKTINDMPHKAEEISIETRQYMEEAQRELTKRLEALKQYEATESSFKEKQAKLD